MKSIRKFFGGAMNDSLPTSPTGTGGGEHHHKGAHKAKSHGVKKKLTSPTAGQGHHFPHSTPRTFSPQPNQSGRFVTSASSAIPPALCFKPRVQQHSPSHIPKHEADIFSPVEPVRSDTFHDPREHLGENLMASTAFERSGMVLASGSRFGSSKHFGSAMERSVSNSSMFGANGSAAGFITQSSSMTQEGSGRSLNRSTLVRRGSDAEQGRSDSGRHFQSEEEVQEFMRM